MTMLSCHIFQQKLLCQEVLEYCKPFTWFRNCPFFLYILRGLKDYSHPSQDTGARRTFDDSTIQSKAPNLNRKSNRDCRHVGVLGWQASRWESIMWHSWVEGGRGWRGRAGFRDCFSVTGIRRGGWRGRESPCGAWGRGARQATDI
jgi:hypothetical protein